MRPIDRNLTLKCILDWFLLFFFWHVANSQSWGSPHANVLLTRRLTDTKNSANSAKCGAAACFSCLHQDAGCELRLHKGALVGLREMDCWKWKQESLDWQRRVCDEAKWEMKQKKKKKKRECRKPLATCLQSAICWWRGSWRGGAQHPFLAMRSSLINKTKRVSCVTPICYLHPSSRTPFISV